MTTIDVSLAALTDLVERHRRMLQQWEEREQRLDALISAATLLVGRQVIAENREALDALAESDRRVSTPSLRVYATVSSLAKQQQGGTLWIEWDSHAHIEDGIPLRDDQVELWGGLIGKQVELVIAPSDPPDKKAEQ